MRRAFLLLPCLVLSAMPATASGDEPKTDSVVLTEVPKSVVWLSPLYGDGETGRATGFVVARPGDRKKLIVTAGHIFRENMSLLARLPGMKELVICDLIAVSEKHDLMVVCPSE